MSVRDDRRLHPRMKTDGVFLLLLLVLGYSLSTYVPCSPCECYLQHGQLSARCSRSSLKNIPNTIPRRVNHFFLNVNHIHVNNNTFQRFKDLKTLDLSSNEITTLAIDSFVHNGKLKTLNLCNNTLSKDAFPKGVFRSQKALTSLDITMNQISEYPDAALSDLVSISSLVVDGLPVPVFGKGFSNLKLRNLDMSGKHRRCKIWHLTNDSFANLVHLFYLDVSKCAIIQIDAGAFLPLRRIDTIDVSNNKYLGYDVFGKSFYGLRNSSIRVVKANRIVSEFSIGKVLNVEHVKYFLDTNMIELSFDFNRLEIVESKVVQYLSKLETLSVKGNRFVFGPYLWSGDGLKNMRTLEASYQYAGTAFELVSKWRFNTKRSTFVDREDSNSVGILERKENDSNQITDTTDEQINLHIVNTSDESYGKEDDMFNKEKEFQHLFSQSNGLQIRIPFPKQLQIMNLSHSKLAYSIRKIIFYNNSIRVVDASRNQFTEWNGPLSSVTGHFQVEYVDLSNNFCKTINSTFFHSSPFLRTLNISNNYLSVNLSNDVEGLTFKHSTHLRTLRISHNILRNLPQSLFSELRQLEYLDLSWNSLSSWTVDISHMVHLQHLDISYNRFIEIPLSLTADIDKITKHHQSLSISIKGNSLRCDCQTLESLQWMIESKVTFPELNVTTCQLMDMSFVLLGDLQQLVSKLQLRCKTTSSLVVGLSLGVLVCLLLSVAGVVYRYRWKLRYLYYTTRRKHRGYQRLCQEQDNFNYDAFISYADEDRSFVIDEMRVTLEDRFGLKLCIHHRDFMVGQAITDNIINAIQTSRRTVVVLSPSFVKSSWCLYEVHMARLEGVYTGRDVMCVVWYKDPPSTRELSSDLLEELATGTYLKYEEQDKEMFWESLRNALAGTQA